MRRARSPGGDGRVTGSIVNQLQIIEVMEHRVSCMVFNPNSRYDQMMISLGSVLKQRIAEC